MGLSNAAATATDEEDRKAQFVGPCISLCKSTTFVDDLLAYLKALVFFSAVVTSLGWCVRLPRH